MSRGATSAVFPGLTGRSWFSRRARRTWRPTPTRPQSYACLCVQVIIFLHLQSLTFNPLPATHGLYVYTQRRCRVIVHQVRGDDGRERCVAVGITRWALRAIVADRAGQTIRPCIRARGVRVRVQRAACPCRRAELGSQARVWLFYTVCAVVFVKCVWLSCI